MRRNYPHGEIAFKFISVDTKIGILRKFFGYKKKVVHISEQFIRKQKSFRNLLYLEMVWYGLSV